MGGEGEGTKDVGGDMGFWVRVYEEGKEQWVG